MELLKAQQQFDTAVVGQSVLLRLARNFDGRRTASLLLNLINQGAIECRDSLTLEASATCGIDIIDTFMVVKTFRELALPPGIERGIVSIQVKTAAVVKIRLDIRGNGNYLVIEDAPEGVRTLFASFSGASQADIAAGKSGKAAFALCGNDDQQMAYAEKVAHEFGVALEM